MRAHSRTIERHERLSIAQQVDKVVLVSSYTIERADLLTAQLKRFHHGRAHHLAGQFANLEFWMTEVEHAIGSLDGYTERFGRLRDAQAAWVEAHNTQVPTTAAGAETRPPRPPQRLSGSERTDTRRALVDATYHLLMRFFRIGLLAEADLREQCNRIGTSIDPADLHQDQGLYGV